MTATETVDEIDFNEQVRMIRAERDAIVPIGFLDKPALIIIDIQKSRADWSRPDRAEAQRVLRSVEQLLETARATGTPVFHVGLIIDQLEQSCDHMRLRYPEELSKKLRSRESSEFIPSVAPIDGEVVIEKAMASSFFGTPLQDELAARGVNTVLIAGASTSGCIRATVVDASAHNYRVGVVEDCVYDWRPVSKEVALYDIADRYGDVVSLDTALTYLTERAG